MQVPEYIEAERVHAQRLAHLDTVFPVRFRNAGIVHLGRLDYKRLAVQQEGALPHFKLVVFLRRDAVGSTEGEEERKSES